jgi:tetratricopeptide (TPR) repeat protein
MALAASAVNQSEAKMSATGLQKHTKIVNRSAPTATVVITLVAALGLSGRPAQQNAPADNARGSVRAIVTKIQRADYEGDRAALKRLHDELASFAQNKELDSRVQYWRGFALWRRAMNGFNDKVEPADLQADLKQALGEFDDAVRKDPGFGDAKIGALSCVSLTGASVRMSTKDPARMQELLAQWRQRRKDAETAAPENPRLFWVLGPDMFYIPPERGGGQAKAIEMYEKGLELIRKHRSTASDPLEPSWGEPELLMNLAYSSLSKSEPDLDAAEQYGRSALELVPYWHYLRDILMPRIREAKAEQQR